ncbi:hypothetical protein VJ923_04390 [Adlercreutzia sp. R25]|uniref:hypothetical protein n=1 Tax=Adlercreutzia shanghongiae TaxID=3111773 RepID=UPI002DB6410A|nr:hypothetical protein [Adlercreutzia sp. R25]MEC4272400.1 hypothetical protein [Adlercreutzia sp. R25]
MICENCGCDYARSRPACPECGTPASGYEKWATDGEWAAPAPVEGEELPPVLASWRTSVGWSIAGLLVGSYLVGFACMAVAALLAAGLTAILLGAGAPLAQASPVVQFALCVGLLTGVLQYAVMIIYAVLFYPSYFTNRPQLRSSAVISFANCAFGGLVFGLLWNSNLTKRVKGMSAKVCTALYAACLALFIVATPVALYFGNVHPQEFLRAWSQAYPEMADPGARSDVSSSGHSDASADGRDADAPEATAPEAELASTDLEAAQKVATTAIGALPDNLTCVMETEVVADGQSRATAHVEILRDGRDAVLYVETDGNEDDAMLTFFQGDENMVFQGGLFVSKGEGGLPEDSTGSEQALALVDLAGQAYAYDHEEGVTEYVFVVEGSVLPPDMNFEGVKSVDYIDLHYYLDADGVLVELYTEVNGIAPAAQGGDPVVVSADAWYSDFGTTEVPLMPEGY